MKRSAFTLAEVLVTMGIIGVIAALTVPTLVSNYQRDSYVTQLRKVYTEMSQAAELYKSNGKAQTMREAGIRSNANLQTFLRDYFKISKDCGMASTPCFAADYYTMSGAEHNGTYAGPSVILASGAALQCQTTAPDSFRCLVDVNGVQDPNILGRDLIEISVAQDGTVGDIPSTSNNCESDARWDGCFQRILDAGWKMNY